MIELTNTTINLKAPSGKEFTLDVMQECMTIHNLQTGKPNVEQWIDTYLQHLNTTHNLDLTVGNAYHVYIVISRAYEEIKKKQDGLLALDFSTRSILSS